MLWPPPRLPSIDLERGGPRTLWWRNGWGEWLSLAVIQPSPFCNINCDYCYLSSRSDTHRMSETTLRSVVRGIFSTDLAGKPLTFVWHTGEPLAFPISWHQRAFEIIHEEAPYILLIIHLVQNDNTLIDKD